MNVNNETLFNTLAPVSNPDFNNKIEANISFLKKQKVFLENIVFPNFIKECEKSFHIVLQKLGSILFKACEFWCSGLEIPNISKFYENCEFHSDWIIRNEHRITKYPTLFQDCIFYKYVYLKIEDFYEYPIIEYSLFKNCMFEDKLEFEGVIFKQPIFKNTNNQKTSVNQLIINNCTIDNKFILNNCDINELRLISTTFNDLVNLSNMKFIKFQAEKTIFNKLVIFEESKFGHELYKTDNKYTTLFDYTTFLSHVNFRKTIFYSGLDIEKINLTAQPNFLNTEIHFDNTSRETFRIIKNSFDVVGNYIEANRFFVCEMKKYKQEIKKSGSLQEKFILYFNDCTSNFGQSYVKPIFLIILLAFIFYQLQWGYIKNLLYSIYPPEFISCAFYYLNNMAKAMIPFSFKSNMFLIEGMEAISLLIHIINSCFIWLTIVAIKRRTKR